MLYALNEFKDINSRLVLLQNIFLKLNYINMCYIVSIEVKSKIILKFSNKLKKIFYTLLLQAVTDSKI